jgi:uncharacterized protein (UPF0303 family)
MSPLTSLPKVTDEPIASSPKAIIELIASQEHLCVFKEFTSATAWEVGNAIRNAFFQSYAGVGANGTGQAKSAVVKIVTFSGHQLFTTALGEAPAVGPGNWYVSPSPLLSSPRNKGETLLVRLHRITALTARMWVDGKTNTVKKSGCASYRFGQQCVLSHKLYSLSSFLFRTGPKRC